VTDGRLRTAVLCASLALVVAPALRVAAQTQPVQAGVAAAVRGSVRMAEQPGTVGRDLTSGMPVYLGSEITTGPNAGLQIMLLDETVFTIGPDSKLRVDEFVYDPRGGDGKLSATISKGVFRFVSGRIAQRQPQNMKVDLPSGTIGIRGTSAMGETDGTSTSVVLLGPGATNNAGERPGRIQVSNEAGSVELRAPLFGTTIGAPGTPPSPAALWSSARLDALTGSLAAAPAPAENQEASDGGADGQTAQQGEQGGEKQDEKPGASQGEPQAGEGKEGGVQDARPGGPAATSTGEGGADQPAPIGTAGPSPSELGGQVNVQTIAAIGSVPFAPPPSLPPPSDLPPSPGVPMLSEMTTFDQMRSVPSGVAFFQALNVPLQGPGTGFYNLDMKIDFAAQEISLGRFDGVYQFTGQPQNFFRDMLGTPDVFNYAAEPGVANNFSDGNDGGRLVQPNGDEVRNFVEILNSGNQIAGRVRTAIVVRSAQTGQELSGGAIVPAQLTPPNTTAGPVNPNGPVVP
jgi:hypothetical protein